MREILKIRLADTEELWDEVEEIFIYKEFNVVELEIEHSLATISKWERKWHKAFLKKTEKSNEEMFDYFKCMIVNIDADDAIIAKLINDVEAYKKVVEFMNDPMTAVYFREDNNGHYNSETITNELIYYWMLSLQMQPSEFEHWHINHLMALIKVCNIKNAPPKKRGANQIMRDNAALNAARKAKMGTKG